MADHHLSRDPGHVHYDWDRDRDPVLDIDPGASVTFECFDAADGRLPDDATPEDVAALDVPGHAMTGPVRVAGAEPGDTLAVDVLDVSHEGVGWTWVYPGEAGRGFLPDEFPRPAVHTWDLDGEVGHFVEGIEVPLAPFPGNLGVAPAEPGPHSTTPPRRVGGNLDVKHLTAGATLYLPVEVAGALFSVGDLHAAQGDGEVCITAVEMPGEVTLRFRLSDRNVDGPELDTAGPFAPAGDGPVTATTGLGDDIDAATRDAVRAMVTRLVADRGLAPAEAYMLCSVAADLKVSEVVNDTVAVTAYLGV
ncbi:acetamidase/formamidase family protein [Halosegnis marinus]|uniref:Acetamidase/formamidase family protein n=1 Tax=Halosegnis marinus TaxID=3034023 RepID=A0ABD5ZLT2_9EURY|nr:acetamidase/formamidase family protein [Halosegnis sp. DT85]